MATVAAFTFNPFQENTYIIYDDTNDCIIVDPGCFTAAEKQEMTNFIESAQLKPVRLINTHCHLDHIFGNKFISETYNLPLEAHKGEIPVLERAPIACQMYGIPYPEPSPMPEKFIEEGDIIKFGETELETLFTPGHSPASLSFYCKASSFIIAGDVLFYQSIGRTDLPGGDFDTLISSIKTQLFPLPNDTRVYSGHGQATSIGFEKQNNPFL